MIPVVIIKPIHPCNCCYLFNIIFLKWQPYKLSTTEVHWRFLPCISFTSILTFRVQKHAQYGFLFSLLWMCFDKVIKLRTIFFLLLCFDYYYTEMPLVWFLNALCLTSIRMWYLTLIFHIDPYNQALAGIVFHLSLTHTTNSQTSACSKDYITRFITNVRLIRDY